MNDRMYCGWKDEEFILDFNSFVHDLFTRLRITDTLSQSRTVSFEALVRDYVTTDVAIRDLMTFRAEMCRAIYASPAHRRNEVSEEVEDAEVLLTSKYLELNHKCHVLRDKLEIDHELRFAEFYLFFERLKFYMDTVAYGKLLWPLVGVLLPLRRYACRYQL